MILQDVKSARQIVPRLDVELRLTKYNNYLNKSNEEIVVMNRFNTIKSHLNKMPIALSGLALAIASLSTIWDNFIGGDGQIQLLGSVVASCILILLFFKYLFNVELLKRELQHVVAGSVAPTYTMAMMLVANNIAAYYFKLGEILSFIAIFAHIYLFVCFVYYRIKNFKLIEVSPSWFIPPVGLVLAVTTFPGGLDIDFAEQLLNFGFISYILLLPFVLYRWFFMGALSDGEKPFFVILATPPSLLLISYLEITNQASYLFVWGLVMAALLMTFCVYLALIKLVRVPFTPAYSAFTFPLVISAIALFKTSAFLLSEGFPSSLVTFTTHFATIELSIASLIVMYVCIRYTQFFSQVKH
jgi:tellurite resistance protein TehA-like permease